MHSAVSDAKKDVQKVAKLHQPVLDGIRGIAIIAVLLTHSVTVTSCFPPGLASKIVAYLFTPGWAGVDLFFVLSGFLITGILLSTKHASNYFQSFYARRVLRIFPIYYLTLTGLLVAGTYSPWVNSLLPAWPMRRLSFFFYLQNFPYFMRHGNQGWMFGHFWSLAVEEQFYLVWPFLVLFLKERPLLWLCGVGILVALPVRTYLALHHIDDFRVMMLTTSRVDGLLVGAGCAIYSHIHKRPVPLKWITVMFALGLLIIGYIAVWHTNELLGTSLFMPSIGITGFAFLSGALLALSQHRFKLTSDLLSTGWLRSFGKYSYGIYVYHVMVYFVSVKALTRLGISMPLPITLAFVYVAALIGATFLIAKLSYNYFEKRFLNLKHHFEPQYEEAPVQSPAFAMETTEPKAMREAAGA